MKGSFVGLHVDPCLDSSLDALVQSDWSTYVGDIGKVGEYHSRYSVCEELRLSGVNLQVLTPTVEYLKETRKCPEVRHKAIELAKARFEGTETAVCTCRPNSEPVLAELGITTAILSCDPDDGWINSRLTVIPYYNEGLRKPPPARHGDALSMYARSGTRQGGLRHIRAFWYDWFERSGADVGFGKIAYGEYDRKKAESTHTLVVPGGTRVTSTSMEAWLYAHTPVIADWQSITLFDVPRLPWSDAANASVVGEELVLSHATADDFMAVTRECRWDCFVRQVRDHLERGLQLEPLLPAIGQPCRRVEPGKRILGRARLAVYRDGDRLSSCMSRVSSEDDTSTSNCYKVIYPEVKQIAGTLTSGGPAVFSSNDTDLISRMRAFRPSYDGHSFHVPGDGSGLEQVIAQANRIGT